MLDNRSFKVSVLGIPVEVVCDSCSLSKATRACMEGWPVANGGSGRPLRFHLRGENLNGDACRCSKMSVRKDGSYLFVTTPGGIGFVDRRAGFASAFVSDQLAHDRTRFRLEIVEHLALYLAAGSRRAALHAAGIVVDGRCILVTGDRGAGKSTLAYTAMKSGCGILSDDIVYAEPCTWPPKIWGNPYQLRLLPDSEEIFPELAGIEPDTMPDASLKRCIRVPEQQARYAEACSGVLHLERTSGETRIVTGGRDTVERSLAAFAPICPPDMQAAINQAAIRVARLPHARLIWGDDRAGAIETVRAWAGDVLAD